MGKNIFSDNLSRREFLASSSTALAGLAVGCGRRNTVNPSEPAAETVSMVSPDQAADTLFINGNVLTVDASNSKVQAVAIKNGLIQAVGKDRDLMSMAGEQTIITDLGGRTATPGFIDPHVHFKVMGMDYLYYIPFLPPTVKESLLC